MSLQAALLVLFLFNFFGSGVIPLPVTAWTFWMGQYHAPVAVVLAGSIGNGLGWLVWRGFLLKLIRKKPGMIEKIPPRLRELYGRRTGLMLFLSNALPLPIEPMRFLALMNDYPPMRLLVILTTGRIIRSMLLVTMGQLLMPYKYLFWTVLFLLLLSPVLYERIDRWARARRAGGLSRTEGESVSSS